MRTSKWEPSVLSMRNVPLHTNTREISAAGGSTTSYAEGKRQQRTTCVHSGPVKTRGCCIGKLVVLSIKQAPEEETTRSLQSCYAVKNRFHDMSGWIDLGVR